MKLKLGFLLFLCPIFGVSAQEKITNNNTNRLGGGLTIGDKVPDVSITHVAGFKNDKSTVRLISDFKGQLLIIDFWATWCSPCRAMVPVMDSLRKVFDGQVVFLPVTYENAAVTAPVLAAMQRLHPFNLPEVTGDTVLNTLFPHKYLPHYVWIRDGLVTAITEAGEVNGTNIRKMLSGENTIMAVKKDKGIMYHKDKPFLLAGNGGDGASVIYHDVLSGYVPGLSGGIEVTANDSLTGQRISARNTAFLWLCKLAYADSGRFIPAARIRVLSVDSSRMDTRLTGQAYLNWLAAGNGWCYELQVPPRLAGEPAFKIVREDIGRLFPAWSVTLEHRTVPSLVLIRTSAEDKLKSRGGEVKVDIGPFSCHLHNASLKHLIIRLERQFMQHSNLPIADGTGYKGWVDIDIDAPLTDVKSLNTALAPYGLALIQKDYPAELLVIRDKSI